MFELRRQFWEEVETSREKSAIYLMTSLFGLLKGNDNIFVMEFKSNKRLLQESDERLTNYWVLSYGSFVVKTGQKNGLSFN